MLEKYFYKIELEGKSHLVSNLSNSCESWSAVANDEPYIKIAIEKIKRFDCVVFVSNYMKS